MGIPKTALALSAALAAAGCAGAPPKAVIAPVQEYAQLPTRTAAEQKVLDETLKDQVLVFSQGGNVYQQNLNDGTHVELSRSLTGTYGTPDQTQLVGNTFYFVKNRNLYSCPKDDISKIQVVLPNVPISKFQITENNIVLADAKTLRKVKRDGSNLETLISDFGDIKDFAVSPDGQYVVCTLAGNYGMKRKAHVLADVKTGEFQFIKFQPSYEDAVEDVSWMPNATDYTLAFTTRKGDSEELCTAHLSILRTKKGNQLAQVLVEDPRQITFDNADISAIRPSEKGTVIVSNKPGVPAAYLLTNEGELRLTPYAFNGENLSLVQK